MLWGHRQLVHKSIGNDESISSPDHGYSFRFTAPRTATINSVTITMGAPIGAPPVLVFNLCSSDSSGYPGTILAYATVSPGVGNRTATFTSPYQIQERNIYHMLFHGTAGYNSTNYINYRVYYTVDQS